MSETFPDRSCTTIQIRLVSHVNVTVRGSVALIGTWIGHNPGDPPDQTYDAIDFGDRPSTDFGPLTPGQTVLATFQGCARVASPTADAQYHLEKPEIAFSQA